MRVEAKRYELPEGKQQREPFSGNPVSTIDQTKKRGRGEVWHMTPRREKKWGGRHTKHQWRKDNEKATKERKRHTWPGGKQLVRVSKMDEEDEHHTG